MGTCCCNRCSHRFGRFTGDNNDRSGWAYSTKVTDESERVVFFHMVVDEKQVDMLQSSRENGVGTRPHSKSIPAILGANLFKQLRTTRSSSTIKIRGRPSCAVAVSGGAPCAGISASLLSVHAGETGAMRVPNSNARELREFSAV